MQWLWEKIMEIGKKGGKEKSQKEISRQNRKAYENDSKDACTRSLQSEQN